MKQNEFDLLWWLWMLALAATGGGLGHIMRQLDKGAPVSWARVLFEVICAAFAGALVMLVCQSLHFSPQWTGVIVGVFGWVGGSTAMRYLERMVSKRLDVDNKKGDDDVQGD